MSELWKKKWFKVCLIVVAVAANLYIVGVVALTLLLAAASAIAIGSMDGHHSDTKPHPPELLYGVIDTAGKVIVPTKYLEVHDYSDGLAAITNGPYVPGRKYSDQDNIDFSKGYIDRDGREVIKPKFFEAGPFVKGFAHVKDFGTKVDHTIDHHGNVCETAPKAATAKKWKASELHFGDKGLYKGEELIAVRESGDVKKKTEGLIAVREENDKWVFMTEDCKYAFPSRFEDVRQFSGGLAAVKVGNLWGYIDKEGKMAIQPKFSGEINDDVFQAGEFSDGLAAESQGKLYGYVNTKGDFVIPPKFSYARKFKDGMAEASDGELWGLIDKTGKYVLKPKYAKILDFSEGLAAVKNSYDYWGYIDKNFVEVIPCAYDLASNCHDGRAIVAMGRKGHLQKKAIWEYVLPQSDE